MASCDERLITTIELMKLDPELGGLTADPQTQAELTELGFEHGAHYALAVCDTLEGVALMLDLLEDGGLEQLIESVFETAAHFSLACGKENQFELGCYSKSFTRTAIVVICEATGWALESEAEL